MSRILHHQRWKTPLHFLPISDAVISSLMRLQARSQWGMCPDLRFQEWSQLVLILLHPVNETPPPNSGSELRGGSPGSGKLAQKIVLIWSSVHGAVLVITESSVKSSLVPVDSHAEMCGDIPAES